MQTTPRQREIMLFFATALFSLLSALLPAIPLAPHYHDFADQRTLWGLPCALDVLSNAPFAAWGVWGLWVFRENGALPPAQQTMLRLFFWGLMATAFTSSYYHLQPNDVGLAIDRLGMTLAFAGLVGLSASIGVSERAGQVSGWGLLGLGLLSVWIWHTSGNMTPWSLFQGGGMVLILGLAFLAQPCDGLRVQWGAVLAIYAVAKVFEYLDAEIFQWTGVISGHTIKHLVASLAAWPVIRAVAHHQTKPLRVMSRMKTVRLGS